MLGRSSRRILEMCSLEVSTAAILFLAIASPAHAGLGDLVKKAKDKATKAVTKPKAEDDCAGKQATFDAVVIELTEDRLGKIIATFKAAGDAAAGRSTLVEKLNAVEQEQSAVHDEHDEEIRAARNSRGDVETCYHDGYREAQERRAQEYTNRVLSGDPALLAKFSKTAQKNNEAAARGDTAAQQRIMQTIKEETQPTRADSLAVQKKCGPLPARSKAETQLEALDEQAKTLRDQIAAIDDKVAKAQAKEGGLTQQQWSMALERIQYYLSWKRSKTDKRLCGYGEAELQGLEKHFEQLNSTLG